jgi:hypothetical protein
VLVEQRQCLHPETLDIAVPCGRGLLAEYHGAERYRQT